MKTQVMGQAAEWTPEIEAKWTRALEGVDDPWPVESANYFRPRPYVDQYNAGSREEGFTYVRASPGLRPPDRRVYQVIIRRHHNVGGDN